MHIGDYDLGQFADVKVHQYKENDEQWIEFLIWFYDNSEKTILDHSETLKIRKSVFMGIAKDLNDV